MNESPRELTEVKMEKVRCALCGSQASNVILKTRDYRYSLTNDTFHIVQCINCGLVYLNPRPVDEEIGWFYPKNGYCKETIPTSETWETLGHGVQSRVRKIMRIKKKGKILDLGCGNGEFLLHFKKKGWNTYGVDISEDTCRIAREKLKKNVFNSDLKGCEFPDSFFDVVVLNHVFEHLLNPKRELKEIHKILKDDGILFLAVPNINSFQFKLLKEKWSGLDCPRHAYHYSSNTLKAIVQKVGFEPIKVSYPLLEFSLGMISVGMNQNLLERYHKIKQSAGMYHPEIIIFTLFFLLLSFFNIVYNALYVQGRSQLEIFARKVIF